MMTSKHFTINRSHGVSVGINKDRRVTIRDIAAKAGVSPATVSLALNDKGNLNGQTRIRIKNIARGLRYVPSPLARGLRGGHTGTIGVIIDHFHNRFFTGVFAGIEQVCDEAGYTFMVAETHERLEKERIQLVNMAERGVDGIILLPCSRDYSCAQTIRERYGIPVVLIGNFFEENPFISVVADNWNGARLITEHLLFLGREPIIHIAGSQDQTKIVMRRRGFESTIKEKTGIPVPEDQLFFVSSIRPEEGYRAMREVTARFKPPFSLFVVNDDTALGVLRYCRERGLRVPQDVAVAGFSDMDIQGDFNSFLTSVRIPASMMGNKAASLLLGSVDNPEEHRQLERVVLPVTLIVRESTAL